MSAKDPWENRSAGMQCSTCIWFVSKRKYPEQELKRDTAEDGNRVVGRCRKHAPSMGGYPVVFSNDWCGDHRLDENKI